jgi:zinc transport system substrate-binding protein
MLYYYMLVSAMRKCTVVLVLLVLATSAKADIKVIASIKPVHSLVAAVMQGVGTPALLLNGAASPHTYTLKPSDAEALSQADLIFWVGPDLESFMVKPIESLSTPEKSVSLIAAKGIKSSPPRSGAGFVSDGDHGTVDPHIWLSPDNAKAMVAAIAAKLSSVDSEHASIYENNADHEIARLAELQSRLHKKLDPISAKGFIVFHDAYQYFESSFGLKAVGAIAIHPESPPSASVLINLRGNVKSQSAVCVFAEPQFDPKLVTIVTEGTSAKTGTLDPIGANETPGPDLYFNVMEALAASLADCLSS